MTINTLLIYDLRDEILRNDRNITERGPPETSELIQHNPSLTLRNIGKKIIGFP